jgi:16S rRNA (guanine966-N2)-methyltransferase
MIERRSRSNSVRIVGGKWRSRILHFNFHSSLRPTPNAVRETLFNWLTPAIQNAICLDLFAGSGALGFEALSRGAKHVVMVDQSKKIVDSLRKNAELLGGEDITFILKKFSTQLTNIFQQKFDIVFLDPPFHQDIITPTCFWLEEQGCLNDGAYIYTESESSLQEIIVPANWQLHRQKVMGQVKYSLFLRK